MKYFLSGCKFLATIILPLMGIILFVSSCTLNNKPASDKENKYKDYIKGKPAPEWNALLQHDTGWIAADGIYALALNGVESAGTGDSTETFMWFSDTIVGKIEDDSLQKGWGMVHNSVAYFKGMPPDPSKAKFHIKRDGKGKIQSFFEPHTPATLPGDYYWLGDGVFDHAKDSTIYLTAYRIHNVDDKVWPFKMVGISFIALPKGSRPPFNNQRQIESPLFQADKKGRGNLSFGNCLLPNTKGARAPRPDGYIYVYGIRGAGELIVARVKDSDFEDFSQWRFWDGQTWNTDEQQCAKLIDHAASEMSVGFMDDGRVLLTYEYDSTSPDIVIQVGSSPTGPFYRSKKVWETPETYEDIDYYTYNAKAFPHLSKPGELLISYNLNAFNFEKTFEKRPNYIFPKFITVKYK